MPPAASLSGSTAGTQICWVPAGRTTRVTVAVAVTQPSVAVRRGAPLPRRHLDNPQRRVVDGGGGAAVLADGGEQGAPDRGHRLAAQVGEQLLQAALAEGAALAVLGLDQAVGVEHEHVAGVERRGVTLVGDVLGV